MPIVNRLFPNPPDDGPPEGAAHDALSMVARLRHPAVLAVILLFLLTACGGTTNAAQEAGSASGASSDVRDLAFTSTTVSGESFEGTSLAGKPTVLWFWAPWCPTCRGQIAGVSDLAAAHPNDLNVVGVGSLDEPTAIADFAAEVSPEVTMLSDDDGAVWRHFGVTAQSTYLVLDKFGKQMASGYLSDEELDKVVNTMVG